MKSGLEAINYFKHNLKICADLKVQSLIVGLQFGYIKYKEVWKVTVHSYIYYNAVYIAFVSTGAEYGFHWHQGTVGPFFKLVNPK